MVDRQGDKSSISEKADAANASGARKKTWSTPSLRRLDGRSANAGKPGISDGEAGTQTS